MIKLSDKAISEIRASTVLKGKLQTCSGKKVFFSNTSSVLHPDSRAMIQMAPKKFLTENDLVQR